MRRRCLLGALTLTLASLTGACATASEGGSSKITTTPPTLGPGSTRVRAPAVALPFHRAPIVDVALLPPAAGQRWRVASGDEDGWVRVWADGALVFAAPVHAGGVSAVLASPEGALITAGFDGRVLEWRDSPKDGVPRPARAWGMTHVATQASEAGKGDEAEQAEPKPGPPPKPAPITAVAVAGSRMAISDGYHVQVWSRGDTPELLWSRSAKHFVTGLSLSPSGKLVAAAGLSPLALRKGRADHPLAPLEAGGYPSEALELRRFAARDFPGARADFVETWDLTRPRHREIYPGVPIDPDLILEDPSDAHGRGLVVFREVWSGAEGWVTAVDLRTQKRVWKPLVKPWPFITEGEVGADERGLPVGDVLRGPAGELVVVDHHADWSAKPPSTGWLAADRRELGVGYEHAAIGDGQGGLVVAPLSGKAGSWTVPGEERPALLGVAATQPVVVTATLGARTRYRVFELASGLHRLLRVESPAQVLPERADGRPTPAVFPADLVIDDRGEVATSGWTFDDGGLAYGAIRTVAAKTGAAKVLHHGSTSDGFHLGLSPDGAELRAWTLGEQLRVWLGGQAATLSHAEGVTPVAGLPLFSRNGAWSATVGRTRRELVNRRASRARHFEGDSRRSGDDLIAALGDGGVLALVQPFGGGELELLFPPAALEGEQAEFQGVEASEEVRRVELPGAATALAWVGGSLVIGFQDGSIGALLEGSEELARAPSPDAEPNPMPVRILHAGAGGRVWSLAALGDGSQGVFVELDERGLTLHRLRDDAFLELHVADRSASSRHASSEPQSPRAQDMVALWRPHTSGPPCVVLDGSAAGVWIDPAAEVQRWAPERAAAFFRAFTRGGECGVEAPTEPEPPPPAKPEAPTEPETPPKPEAPPKPEG